MKKIILSIIMTLLVVIGGVGGYFTYKYFDLKKEVEGSSVISNAEIKRNLDAVCKNAGWISSETQKTAKQMRINKQPYEKEAVEIGDFRYEDEVKNFILFARYAFEENIVSGTYYSSKGSLEGSGLEHEVDFIFQSYESYANIYMVVKVTSISSEGSYEIPMVIQVFKEKDNKFDLQVLSFEHWHYMTDGYAVLSFTSDYEKLYRVAYMAVSTDKNLSEISKENITSSEIFLADSINKECVDTGFSSLSDDEINEYIELLKMAFINVGEPNFNNISKFQNSNLLGLMYAEMGNS